MSLLQDSSKNLLSKLIFDENITLSRRDKTLLASWMAMTTMVLEFDNSHRAITPRERSWLRSLRLPPPTHWMIFAGRVESDTNYIWYFQDPATAYRPGDTQPSSPNIQRTYLSIGKVVLIACSATTPALKRNVTFDEANANFGDLHGFAKIWPPSDSDLKWHSLPSCTTSKIDQLAHAGITDILLEKYLGMLDILKRPPKINTP
jgi:hypothetical protein